MLTSQGLFFWVEIDGRRLIEYGNEIDAVARTTKCWIASEEGKEFRIGFCDSTETLDSGTGAIDAELKVDGALATCSRIQNRKTTGARYMKGIRALNGTAYRNFKFSELTITDDYALVAHSTASPTDLGTLKIDLYHLVRQSGAEDASRSQMGTTWRESVQRVEKDRIFEVLHEKSKKAGAHCVSLGAAYQIKPHTGTKSTQPKMCRSHPDVPLYTFIIYYRPLAHLQAANIAPIPPHSNLKRKLDSGKTQDEKEDTLLDEIKYHKERLSRLTAQRDVKRKVKREILDHSAFNGEIIDLT